jgi:hypothetical protein
MSRHETWRTRRYWESIGGLLIEEFTAINLDRANGTGKRLIDGIIVPDAERRIQTGGTYDFRSKDIIVVQTKKTRLGMYLMGQAFFSRELMRRFEPSSIRTVAICGAGDPQMEALCSQFDIEVVVIYDAEE